jgi:acetyl-CoA carboxylase biotin carboxyl carrier protein
MDLKKIKKLIELLEGSQLSGLEIQTADSSIKLTRTLYQGHAQYLEQHPTASQAQSHYDQNIDKMSTVPDTNHYVRSPMVGTFYRSTAPDKPPLVEIGTYVKLGDTLCVIEAMKILNFIAADKSGCIKKILLGNAEPVEFEQPLFVIE